MILKTTEEIEYIRKSSLLVGKTLALVAKMIGPGVRTLDMDRMAETFIRDHGAKPGFKGYNGFPASLCISVNDEVVHGIPGERRLEEGDIVSVDCGVYLDGYFGDSAYTFEVGEVTEDKKALIEATKKSLYLAIDETKAGKRLGDIGYAVQSYVESKGYAVVRDLVGHGIGKNLHEKPEVPNFGRRGTGPKLKAGTVLAIEPMVNLGSRHVTQDDDGWTIRTSDGKPSAHFEHTVAVGSVSAEILSTFEYIEKAIENIN